MALKERAKARATAVKEAVDDNIDRLDKWRAGFRAGYLRAIRDSKIGRLLPAHAERPDRDE